MRLNRCLFLLPLLLASPGCNNSEGDTFVVNSDCGLIRTDMLGTYTVTFTPVTADLINCSDTSFNGSTVTVTSTPQDFTGVQVFASAFNTGFTFTDGSAPQGLYGNAETDSCAMSFSVLDNEGVYVHCFGTLTLSSGHVSAACDSTSALETPLANPPVVLADCDLDPVLQVTLDIH
jgi:hypothetical protein